MRIGIDVRKLGDYGIGTYITALLERFSALRSDLEFVLYCCAADRSLPVLRQSGYRTEVVQLPNYSLRELAALSWRSRRDRLQLFHSPHYVLPPWRACPAVVTIHDVIHLAAPHYFSFFPARWYAQLMLAYAVRSARLVITVSQSSKHEIMRTLKVSGENIRVIYNGVGAHFSPQPGAAARDRVAHELGIDRPYLLYAGNILPHKNLTRLIGAFALMRQKRPDLSEVLLVIRGGNHRQQLKLGIEVRRLGLTDSVRFLDPVAADVLASLYRACSGFVLPSLYEGFGLPALEAMACGAPVAVSRIAVMEEILAEAALYFSPLDQTDMARTLITLLTDSSIRGKLCDLGSQRVRNFSWDRAAEQTLAVYDAALRGEER